MQQKWKYSWLTGAGVSAWTHKQKLAFHNKADRTIWAVWSKKAKLQASGTNTLVAKFSKRNLYINFDIRWVKKNEHWIVAVHKIQPGVFQGSHVKWAQRKIKLDTNDFDVRNICTAAAPPVCRKQIPVAHEFGHAAGNTVVLGRGDEYKVTSPHVADTNSIMNIGNKLRKRHFDTIVDELNKMITNCTFSVKSI